ncbi:hypothetical protein TNCT_580871 [Trichonephila clavata]|uniref:Uncharacterized protein n=1 Tax=Trichonephila clavata TaxID=2740835 RepID=A0A8X6KWN9_TRICU|nr:hypothetical protein TNCT_580871 [Trichonephila clavata]
MGTRNLPVTPKWGLESRLSPHNGAGGYCAFAAAGLLPMSMNTFAVLDYYQMSMNVFAVTGLLPESRCYFYAAVPEAESAPGSPLPPTFQATDPYSSGLADHNHCSSL